MIKPELPQGTTCAIAGGGPAGMMLALLLARAGIDVTVLEKHPDFLRDFRGDTVHASTLNLIDELGLGPRFAAMPHNLVEQVTVDLGEQTFRLGDLNRLPGPHKHIAMAPQWDFLEMLATAAETEPTFHLRRSTEVTGLLRSGDRITGIEYRTASGETGALKADLTVACDGRGSALRAAAGMRPRQFGVPIDIWWFRLPKHPDDPQGPRARVGANRFMVLLDRGDYFQCGYLIGKGTDSQMRSGDVQVLRDRVAEMVPWLAARTDAIASWDDVKLLDIQLNRLRKWYRDGLLFIGDAAHAMSPVGGVGINLAIADAVATARILAEPLRTGTLTTADLRKVQLRRWVPTAL
ncbi:FAD-dependent oxidoreductase, partial [Mycobacteroides abscessus]